MKCIGLLSNEASALIVALAMLSPMFAFSQDSDLFIYGTTKEYKTGKMLTDFRIVATDLNDSTQMIHGVIATSGKYEMHVPPDGKYLVEVSSLHYWPRSILIDLNGPTEKEWKNDGYGMNIEFVLLKQLPDIDGSILYETFGIAKFNSKTRNFEWDMEYTKKILARQKEFIELYDAKLNE